MSQEIITDYTPFFTGKSGEIESALRDLGQRPVQERIPVKFTEMANVHDVAVSLVRYIYDGLEEKGVPLPPKRRQGRPATRIRCEPIRQHITGKKREEKALEVEGLYDAGLTYYQIQEETGLTKGQTQYLVGQLEKEGRVTRRRNRCGPDEIKLLDDRVEALFQERNLPGASLSYSEMAERLKFFYPELDYFGVYNSTQRLRNQGRIEIPGT